LVLNIVVVGVGGQGILTLSKILGACAVEAGVKALVAETHGMSQRGGSVIVHVRVGNDVYAPTMPLHEAHVMVALEMLEGVRYLNYVNPEFSLSIVNDKVLRPSIPGAKVPEKETILKAIKSHSALTVVVNASEEAIRLGNPAGANMFMLGFLVGLLEFMGLTIQSCCTDKLPHPNTDLGSANAAIFKRGLMEASTLLEGVKEEGIRELPWLKRGFIKN